MNHKLYDTSKDVIYVYMASPIDIFIDKIRLLIRLNTYVYIRKHI